MEKNNELIVSGKEKTSLTATPMPHFGMGVKMDILKQSFFANIEASKDDISLLVIPDLTQEPQEVLVSDLIEAFTGIYKNAEKENPIDETAITSALSGVVDTKKISFSLDMLFFYLKKYLTGTPIPEGELEFAFQISVNANFAPSFKDLFDFKSAYLAIWNTNRKKILEKMNLGSIVDILNSLE